MVAVFGDAPRATKVRVALAGSGIAADRLDVISWSDAGRASVVPANSQEERLSKHFAMLFEGRADAERALQAMVGAVKSGSACVVVHPRGVIEIREARRIIDAQAPEQQYLNLAPPDQQGGILGERAAGD